MNNLPQHSVLEPDSLDALTGIIRAEPKVLPVGARTKDRLCAAAGARLVSTRRLSGITQYEPAEFTFTALAGTPVAEVEQTLRGHGQYLPFAPMLTATGATLGGTVAAGLSGSGAFRFGPLRDFILGVRFADGAGRIITAGGRVVKNAAGFDIPKLMVGSLGRLGILTELTFKVFPRPEAFRTVHVICDSHAHAMALLMRAGVSRWELEALDYRPGERALYFRVGGPEGAVDALVREILAAAPGAAVLDKAQATTLWDSAREFQWVPAGACLVKVPLTPKQFPFLQQRLEAAGGADVHLASGGAVAWIAVSPSEGLACLDEALAAQQLQGLVLRGPSPHLFLGHRSPRAIDAAIKAALDPEARFPSFD